MFAGIVSGYDDGLYQPDWAVLRDQMAVYISRALAGGPTFPDVPDIGYGDDGTEPFWAYKHIEYCVEHGVVYGYDDGWYHPERTVTRDQMAVYVARAFGLES